MPTGGWASSNLASQAYNPSYPYGSDAHPTAGQPDSPRLPISDLIGEPFIREMWEIWLLHIWDLDSLIALARPQILEPDFRLENGECLRRF